MHYRRLQKRIHELLEGGHGPNDRASRWCDMALAILVIANVLAIVLDSIPALHHAWGDAFNHFETFSVGVFTLEYALRVWAAGVPREGMPGSGGWRGRWGYIRSFHGIVDLLATLPFYLEFLFPDADLRVMRTLRLVRVFKLSHYSTAIEDLFQAIRDERRSFIAALYLLLIAVLLTSSLMYFAEHHAQPEKFSSIPDAIYWSLITLTTVGYGDITPVTWAGKVLSLVTAFMGVCTVALLTGIVASSFANQMARRKALFEARARAVLADGHISSDERHMLEQLRKDFNLSAQEADRLLREAAGDLRRREHPQEQPASEPTASR
jgi:voltage-gated potassium channel